MIKGALLVGLLFSSANLWAAITIDSVLLNGNTSISVAAGDNITVSVTATTSGSGSSNDWESTQYTLDGNSVCVDTPDNTSSGQHSETFTITAPAADGTYDFTVTGFRDGSCSQGASSAFSISSAITVSGGVGCSSYLGDATVNEVAQAIGGDPSFIEVRFLDASLSSLVASLGWKVEICSGALSCQSVSLLLSLFNIDPALASNFPWMVLEGGTDFDDSRLDFGNGFSVALLDSDGDVIDLLEVNGYSAPDYGCNSFVYDTDVNGANSGTKSVFRSPDGNGDWSIQQSNAIDETPGGSNDGSGSTLDHYSVTTVSPALTCEAGQVTISPHDSSHTAISSDGTTITLSTSPDNDGWTLISGNGSLVGNTYTFAGGETSVVLGLQKTTPATLDIDVTDGAITDIDGDVDEDEPIEFVEVGLRFYADSNADGSPDGVGNDIPNQVSGVSYAQVLLGAIRTDSATLECESALNSAATIDVNMAYECNNPVSCIRNQDATAASVNIEENNNGNVVSFASVPLSFNASGLAAFPFNYFDAGQISLHATMTIPAQGDDPATPVVGQSNAFVVRPDDFIFTLVESNDSPPIANPGTTDQASGAGFLPAATPFRVVIEAQNANGGLTPNFGNEVSPENVRINMSSVVYPSGGNTGNLNTTTAFTATATQGQFENSTVSWNEVGTFTAYASVADTDYLGIGDVVGSPSGNIGRFYPASITLTGDTVTDACTDDPSGNFSYMSEPAITVSYTLTATNIDDVTVTNYDNSAGYEAASANYAAENADDGEDLTLRLGSIAPLNWEEGVATFNDPSVSFDRDIEALSGNTLIDGPYSQLQLGLTLDEIDGVNLESLDMHPAEADDPSDCVVGNDCLYKQLEGMLDVRFGRLLTRDSHGPESAPLSAPFQTEYWDGSLFVLTAEDSCTSIPGSEVEFDDESIDLNLEADVGTGTTTGSFANFTSDDNVVMVSGDAQLVFSAPNATGSFLLDVDLSSRPWLRFDWNQNGDHDDDAQLPSAKISFGNYRGHDRIIYWREQF